MRTDLPDEGATLDTIGEALGVSRSRAQQIEAQALLKVRFALAIEDALGAKRAAPVLEKLKHKPLEDFRAALAAAREGT